MATKAQILAAAKKIVADAAKKPAKRKANPAPRIGTKKPTRKSQITGKPPTKRLVKRRKANTLEGYFPNPAEVSKAYAENLPFKVQQQYSATGKWKTIGAFKDQEDGEMFFREFTKKHKELVIRLIKE